MKNTISKPRRLTMIVAAVVGLALAPALFASTLHIADLNTAGDKLLTVDSNTGLEFLKPAATVGVSYSDTRATTFVTDQGFRFATLDEFQQLLTDAGFMNFSGDFNTTDELAAEDLLTNFLGETIPSPGTDFTLPTGTRISDGFYSFTGTPDMAGLVNVVGADYQSADLGQAAQDQARVSLHFNNIPLDAAPPIVGGLLVRAVPVPEPADLAMVTGGLGLLLGLVWLRRRSDCRPTDA